MDKDKILEQARLEYTDAGDEAEYEEAGREGAVILVTYFIMAAVFSVLRITHGEPFYDYIAAGAFATGAINAIRFVKLRKIFYLAITVSSFIIAIVTTILFFKSYNLI